MFWQVSIFAYGQTGSGKTHTMVGSQEDFKQRGLKPRSLEHIFDTSQSHKKSGWTYKVEVSCLKFLFLIYLYFLVKHLTNSSKCVGFIGWTIQTWILRFIIKKGQNWNSKSFEKSWCFVFERCFTTFPNGYSKKITELYEYLINSPYPNNLSFWNKRNLSVEFVVTSATLTSKFMEWLQIFTNHD